MSATKPEVCGSMAPSFSKIPVLAMPNMPIISGLMCSHEGCYALFSTLEDSKAHANAVHSGNMAAVTCGIHEFHLYNGKIRLHRVLDEIGEQFIAE